DGRVQARGRDLRVLLENGLCPLPLLRSVVRAEPAGSLEKLVDEALAAEPLELAQLEMRLEIGPAAKALLACERVLHFSKRGRRRVVRDALREPRERGGLARADCLELSLRAFAQLRETCRRRLPCHGNLLPLQAARGPLVHRHDVPSPLDARARLRADEDRARLTTIYSRSISASDTRRDRRARRP